MTDDEIIELLRTSAQLPSKYEHTQPHHFPPATDQEIEDAERTLGFELPPLSKRLYREVGNGGNMLGPAFGIYGVGTGYEHAGQNIVGQSKLLVRDHPWLENFLLVAEGGCGLCFCVDCNDADYPVYYYNGDEISSSMLDEDYDNEEPPDEGWDIEADTFAEWLTAKNYNVA